MFKCIYARVQKMSRALEPVICLTYFHALEAHCFAWKSMDREAWQAYWS